MHSPTPNCIKYSISTVCFYPASRCLPIYIASFTVGRFYPSFHIARARTSTRTLLFVPSHFIPYNIAGGFNLL